MTAHPKVSVFVEATDRTVNVIEERWRGLDGQWAALQSADAGNYPCARPTTWMDRIPDRSVEIQQSLGRRPDLHMYRPYYVFPLPSDTTPQETANFGYDEFRECGGCHRSGRLEGFTMKRWLIIGLGVMLGFVVLFLLYAHMTEPQDQEPSQYSALTL
jgi:hypothetical protein